ncbi:MAG: V-type ATPase subunit [Candidatus Omnitrophica bacterium]|nr:V-type ATPase subunit [Candidatus Omnitrophota bacterium]
MKKVAPEDYAFGIGKVRALERFLLTEEALQHAQDADLSGALQLFAESELYADEFLHVNDSVKLEDLLSQESRQLQDMISRLILDKPLREFLDLTDLGRLQRIAKDYKSQFLVDYLNFVIDMHNIKTFLRLYVIKEPEDRLQTFIRHEGFIPKKYFIHFYAQDIAFFLTRLEYVHAHSKILDYSLFLREGIEKTVKEGQFITLEKQINDFLVKALKPAKYFTFGPEPLLAYYFAKVNEINLIRMIILAKLNNVSGDLVKERLNTVYG